MRTQLTIAVSLLGLVFPVLSQQAKDPPDPVLFSLRTRLTRELKGLEPASNFEVPGGYAGKSLIMRYQTRRYKVYPRNKPGHLGRDLVER